MTYKQVEGEVDFYDRHCVNTGLLYNQLSKEEKIERMAAAERREFGIKKMIAAQLARVILHNRYEELCR
jgi:hypothetical protein